MAAEYEAGRELDTLVAERVMGWPVNRPGDRHWHTTGCPPNSGRQIGNDCCEQHYGRAFMPSRDIAAAWEVVEKLRADGFTVDIIDIRNWREHGDAYWECDVEGPSDMLPMTARADKAPHAICRAALKALASTNQQREGSQT